MLIYGYFSLLFRWVKILISYITIYCALNIFNIVKYGDPRAILAEVTYNVLRRFAEAVHHFPRILFYKVSLFDCQVSSFSPHHKEDSNKWHLCRFGGVRYCVAWNKYLILYSKFWMWITYLYFHTSIRMQYCTISLSTYCNNHIGDSKYKNHY